MFTLISTAILALVAGIGIFLVACQMMSNNLELLLSGFRQHFLFSDYPLFQFA